MDTTVELPGAAATTRARPAAAAARVGWDERIRQTAIVIGRLGLAYLFFTQLFWKAPPTFGCPPGNAFSTAAADGQLVRTSGLCDWIGIESVWAARPRQLLVTDFGNGQKIGLDVSPIVQANGAFLDGFVKPNFGWFAWIIWGSEAFIALSLALGLFSRLGGLVALGVSGQLALGLAGISNPYEWEWAYLQMVLLAILMVGLTPGRWLGIDAWLRPRFERAAAHGNPLARGLLYLS